MKPEIQNSVFDIIKWHGIKNDETKEVTGGYLYLKFKEEVSLLNIDQNTVGATPCPYKIGQIIGFSLKAKNRKEAINNWNKTYQIIYK